MLPIFFRFCSYLHKKLCNVLSPSEPFSDPLQPSAGPKIEDICENSTLQAVIPRGTDRRSACFDFKKFLSRKFIRDSFSFVVNKNIDSYVI